MSIITITSREFNQDVGQAKRCALSGPVFITDRGHPAHVLLSIKDYERIVGGQKNLAELLAMPEAADIEFEPERINNFLWRPEEFS